VASRDERVKALFLILEREAPSSRYRVLQYLPYLEKEGFQCQVMEAPKGLSTRLSTLRGMPSYHLVFVQKRLLSLMEWGAVRVRSRKLVFDFDDAVVYRDSSAGATPSRTRVKRFRRMVRGCELVVAGNDYLAGLARPEAHRVVTVPTPIDMGRYTEKTSSPSEGVTVGWIGGAGTLFYLQALHPVLSEVCGQFMGVRVKVVSNAFPDWSDVPLEKKAWNYGEEIQDLHSLDVGIMPLTDDPWARGKCGFKLLQYMAVGIPVVCSPVGVNREMVTHAGNGFLAQAPEEWSRHLSLLIRDPELRRRLGRAARATVMERYSLENWAGRLAGELRRVALPERP
jgi:glycosyltransferase involved in cell wall biosynthesis